MENLPLDEQTAGTRFATDENVVVGDGGTFLRYTYAAEDYFQTMGIELLAGRHFEHDDHAVGDTRAIVSRSAAELLWPGEDPVGNLFRMVLDDLGPVDDIWMVGDNFDADVRGAGQVGIPGILVRKFHADAEIFCATLTDVIDVVNTDAAGSDATHNDGAGGK